MESLIPQNAIVLKTYKNYPANPIDTSKFPPKNLEDLPDVVRWVDVVSGETNWKNLDRNGIIKYLEAWKYCIWLLRGLTLKGIMRIRMMYDAPTLIRMVARCPRILKA